MDFGEGKKSIYALEGTDILIQRDKEVQLAAHAYGEGRGVYISGLPYSFANSRVLYRAILWAAHSEEGAAHLVQLQLQRGSARLCEERQVLRGEQHLRAQDTTVYTTGGASFALHLEANEIRWYEIG